MTTPQTMKSIYVLSSMEITPGFLTQLRETWLLKLNAYKTSSESLDLELQRLREKSSKSSSG